MRSTMCAASQLPGGELMLQHLHVNLNADDDDDDDASQSRSNPQNTS